MKLNENKKERLIGIIFMMIWFAVMMIYLFWDGWVWMYFGYEGGWGSGQIVRTKNGVRPQVRRKTVHYLLFWLEQACKIWMKRGRSP